MQSTNGEYQGAPSFRIEGRRAIKLVDTDMLIDKREFRKIPLSGTPDAEDSGRGFTAFGEAAVSIDRHRTDGRCARQIGSAECGWVEIAYVAKWYVIPTEEIPIADPEQDDIFRYFEPFPEDASEGEYRIVAIALLIPTKCTEMPGPDGVPPSVAKALGYIRDLDAGLPRARRRAPVDVTQNGDRTYSIIDGNACYAAHRRLGRTSLPVRIIDKKL
jgi:hypothetical protein